MRAVKDGIVGFFQCRLDIFQHAVIVPSRIAQYCKLYLLTRLEVYDIRFRRLRLNQHGAEILHIQNIRCTLRGDHRLALQGSDLHYVAVHRRFNAGIGQIYLGGIQTGLISGDLRINSAYLRLFYRQLCCRLTQILARNHLQFN